MKTKTNSLTVNGVFLSIVVLRLQPIDVACMKQLHSRVNIVPVIGKADTLTQKELRELKKKVNIAKFNPFFPKKFPSNFEIYSFDNMIKVSLCKTMLNPSFRQHDCYKIIKYQRLIIQQNCMQH